MFAMLCELAWAPECVMCLARPRKYPNGCGLLQPELVCFVFSENGCVWTEERLLELLSRLPLIKQVPQRRHSFREILTGGNFLF